MRSTLCLLFAAGALAQVIDQKISTWRASQFSSLLTFGDSYTDESRLGYFINHGGAPPPVGYLGPESLSASDGGRIWARYVVQYSEESINLYDYAVSGAVCSNEITPRFFSYIGINFPDLDGYEIPAFLADKAYDINNATGKTLFKPALTANNAVYAIWDGTNDLGYYSFIQDQEVRGASITDYTNCIWTQVDRLYKSGARYFVMMNVVPLYLAGEYANKTFDGAGPNQYWPNKPTNNLTAISEKMRQYVDTVNAIYEYKTPFELLIAQRYPGANFALYDVNQLFLDIHANPANFLNGTLPYHVNGYVHHCDVQGGNCTLVGDPDSYIWYDELHPSQQTQRLIARNFYDVLDGHSKYATYYSSNI